MEILQTSGTVSSKTHVEGGQSPFRGIHSNFVYYYSKVLFFLLLCIVKLRNQVAAGLWQTGYYGDWIYKGRRGERSPSRELLLALGWLIAAGTLEKVLRKRVQQLDKTLLTPTHVCATDMPPKKKKKKSKVIGGNVCAMKSVCVSGEPSAFQPVPFRPSVAEKTPVAHRLFETPGVEFAVHAGRKSSPAPRGEEI